MTEPKADAPHTEHNSVGTPRPEKPKPLPNVSYGRKFMTRTLAAGVSGLALGVYIAYDHHSRHEDLAANVRDTKPLSAPSEQFSKMSSQQRAALVAKSDARIAKLMGKSVEEMNAQKAVDVPNPNQSSLQRGIAQASDLVGAKSLVEKTGLLDTNENKLGTTDALSTALSLAAIFGAIGGVSGLANARRTNAKIKAFNAAEAKNYENKLAEYIKEENKFQAFKTMLHQPGNSAGVSAAAAQSSPPPHTPQGRRSNPAGPR